MMSPMHPHNGNTTTTTTTTTTTITNQGEDGNDADTTPLMQRNYLQTNNSKPTARRRVVGGGGGPQTPGSLDESSRGMMTAESSLSFSPSNSSLASLRKTQTFSSTHSTTSNDKDHGTNLLTHLLQLLAAIGKCCVHGPRYRPFADSSTAHLYYQDDFNDASWSCTFGTSEENGVWMNTNDQAGSILAFTVWFLLGYSSLTVTLLAQTGGIPCSLAYVYCCLCTLALASHAKTTFTDPGAVPAAAVPRESLSGGGRWGGFQGDSHAMCSQCQTFKPPFSHHCRICNRCISRMDHHCPWMNNCIGIGNLKHFLLFLLYTWICSAFSLTLLGWNYFFCEDEDCTFTTVLIQLVRVMTVISTGSFLFTSSMLMNVTYGLMTGIGTIDRLKKKASNTMNEADEEPIPLKDVFGIGGVYTWPFPLDPAFEDYDRVMGYSTPQRLLREQLREGPKSGAGVATEYYMPGQGGEGGGGGGASSGKEPYFISV